MQRIGSRWFNTANASADNTNGEPNNGGYPHSSETTSPNASCQSSLSKGVGGWVGRVSLVAGRQISGSRCHPPRSQTPGGAPTVRRRMPRALRQTSALSLLFLPLHPFPQVLADISQRVRLGRERLDCLAEAGGLCFTGGERREGERERKNKTRDCGRFRDFSGIPKVVGFEFARILTGACVSATASSDWSLSARFSSRVCGKKTRAKKPPKIMKRSHAVVHTSIHSSDPVKKIEASSRPRSSSSWVYEDKTSRGMSWATSVR